MTKRPDSTRMASPFSTPAKGKPAAVSSQASAPVSAWADCLGNGHPMGRTDAQTVCFLTRGTTWGDGLNRRGGTRCRSVGTRRRGSCPIRRSSCAGWKRWAVASPGRAGSSISSAASASSGAASGSRPGGNVRKCCGSPGRPASISVKVGGSCQVKAAFARSVIGASRTCPRRPGARAYPGRRICTGTSSPTSGSSRPASRCGKQTCTGAVAVHNSG